MKRTTLALLAAAMIATAVGCNKTVREARAVPADAAAVTPAASPATR
jgi:hypothetical protein